MNRVLMLDGRAARRSMLVALVAIPLLAGQFASSAHGPCEGHSDHEGGQAELVAPCWLCDFEAQRPTENRPSPPPAIARSEAPRQPVRLPVAQCRSSVRLAGIPAPRAPPTA